MKGFFEPRLVGEVLTLIDGEGELERFEDAERRVDIEGSFVVWVEDPDDDDEDGGFAVVGYEYEYLRRSLESAEEEESMDGGL